MTSFMPPAQKNWWDVPVGRQEILWIGIALVWCLILFFMMPYWHMYGKQNISNEFFCCRVCGRFTRCLNLKKT